MYSKESAFLAMYDFMAIFAESTKNEWVVERLLCDIYIYSPFQCVYMPDMAEGPSK